MRLRRWIGTLAACVVVGTPVAALAQTPQPTAPSVATLSGTVSTDLEAGLAEAEVRVLGAERAGRTSASGVYRVDSVPAGPYLVQVRRMGFAPHYFSVTLKAGENRDVDIELTALPTKLSAVKVKERSGYGDRDEWKLREFESRRRASLSRSGFLTRDDLARRIGRGGRTLLSAIRTEPPLATCTALVSAFDSRRVNPAMPGRGCRTAISIDGRPAMDIATAVDYPLDLVEAVEIYRGSLTIPVQQAIGLGRNADVLIVIWTGTDSEQ